MVLIFYFLMCSFLVQSQISLWDKHYITYSIENDLYRTKIINEAIKEWGINTLEIKHVKRGEGDIKIYFKNLPEYLAGNALPPEGGIIKINRNDMHFNVSKVLQHEFGHALGLKHSENYSSIMFSIYNDNQTLMVSDRDKLNELYKCRYDSVTLLNGQTYIKFKGRNYERIDLNTNYTTKDKVWHSSIIKVTTMYRNNNYFIISNNKYFEYNYSMHFVKEGNIQELFPNMFHNITAVLTLRNGSIICFLENGYIWYNGTETHQNLFQVFPLGIIQGAYSDFYHLYLVVKDDIYIYDKEFNFITQYRICDDTVLQKIHCCNDYSHL